MIAAMAVDLREDRFSRRDNVRRFRTVAGAMASSLALLAHPGHAQETYSRFGYCSPPTPPACVKAVNPAPADRKRCEDEVERYVATVFTYRTCLSNEMERAVREANDIIDIMRCTKEQKSCASAPGSGAFAPDRSTGLQR